MIPDQDSYDGHPYGYGGAVGFFDHGLVYPHNSLDVYGLPYGDPYHDLY